MGSGPFWNKIPEVVRDEIVDMTLKQPEEASRQITCRFIEEKRYSVSEPSAYHILKYFDLIKSPAFEVITVRVKFENPTNSCERDVADGFHSVPSARSGLVLFVNSYR